MLSHTRKIKTVTLFAAQSVQAMTSVASADHGEPLILVASSYRSLQTPRALNVRTMASMSPVCLGLIPALALLMISKGDNLFVAGVNVGRFRCPAGGMITNFYKNKKGRVKFAISGKVENSLTHRMESVAIVVMDNVTTIDSKEAAALEAKIVKKEVKQGQMVMV